MFKLGKIEQVWSVEYFGTDKYLVGCIYRPDGFVEMNDFERFFTHAKNYVDAKNFKDILIMVGFNFPSIDWSKSGVTAVKKDNCIEEYFSSIFNRQ